MPARAKATPVGNTKGNGATIPQRKPPAISYTDHPTLAPSEELTKFVTDLVANLVAAKVPGEEARKIALQTAIDSGKFNAKPVAKAAATPAKTVTRTLKGIRADERVAVAASEAVNENRDAAEIRGSIVGAIEALKWNLNELGLPVRIPAVNEDGTPVVDEATGEPMEMLTEIGEHLQAVVAPAVAEIDRRMKSDIVI